MYAIIPDIHGDYDRLTKTLVKAGFENDEAYGWFHPKNTKALFLGDFIDSGNENKKVIRTVRAMLDAGEAYAIMGNHELNAILYHTAATCSSSGKKQWLRARSDKNRKQHETFLREYTQNRDEDMSSPRSSDLADVLNWFISLPLYLEFKDVGFRIVHAQWDDGAMAVLNGRQYLRAEDLPKLRNVNDGIGFAVERMLKGMEVKLPKNVSFLDYREHRRTEMRVKWWTEGARTYRNLALSVPDASTLPDDALPNADALINFGANGAPVFVGHYKMHGSPSVEGNPIALCLDYPEQACFYLWKEGDTEIREDRLILVP